MIEKSLEQMVATDAGPGVRGNADTGWLNQNWKCSRCETVHRFDAPDQVPEQCVACGGIAFETIASPVH